MSAPDITIRLFAPADQLTVRALVNAGLGEHFGYVDPRHNPDLDDIAASYPDKGDVFVVATLDGAIVGTGALVVEDARTGRLVRMSVARERRGAGIGQALVYHLIAIARERGLERLNVETNRDWEDAKGLYRACGFTQVAQDAVSCHFALSLTANDGEKGESVIRQLDVRDAEGFRTVRLRALREEPEAFGSSYAEQVGRPPSYFEERLRPTEQRVTLGAFDGDALIGTVTITQESGAKDRHKGVITTMYVAPEVRGRGVGRALLLAAIERARAMPGVEQIHLGVVARMTAARALYRSQGFVVYGTEPHALKLGNGDYLDEELMVLWLNPA
ncbi:MAG: GNAT family N-acetyltransferase [Ktedonobacterales bacterium]